MRFLGFSMLLSAWLLVSAFVLPHTAATAAMTGVSAFAVLLFAALAAGRPALRFVLTAIATLLALTALLVPSMPGPAALSNALVAAALAALSLVSPLHAAPHAPATDPDSD